MVGRKKIRINILFCPLVSQNNRRAFTIVEVLLAAAIGASITGVLFYALTGGQNVNDLSSAKVAAQSQARMVIDWVSRDLRQTVVWELANNSPSATHIKFRPVLGWDISGNTYQLGANYIEYNYNAITKTLTRNVGAQSWVYNDIIAQPFSTRDSLGNLIPLDNSVGTSKKVVILIEVKKVFNKDTPKEVDSTVSLTEEIKIRNE